MSNIMDGLFIFEREKQHGLFYKVKKLLYNKKSNYQDIKIFDTYDIGRVLMLDNVLNITTETEHFYHEPMAHIPIAMVDKPENILIIGGGDFGLAKEVLKHKCIKSLTMCELDKDVINVSRKYFSEWSKICDKDNRFKLVIGNGFDYLNSLKNNEFDVMIIDSTDPYLSAAVLASEKFYKLAYKALKLNGVLIQIIADAVFYKEGWKISLPNAKKIFDVYTPIFMPIPFYSTVSTWGLLLLGKGKKPLLPSNISDEFLLSIPDIKTMTPDVVKGWFSLPPYIKTFLNSI